MLKFLLGSVILSLITLTLVGGVLGFIPGISTLMGAAPKDLGQRITSEDSLAAQSKTGIEVAKLPKDTLDDKGYSPEGKKALSVTYDSKEVTALVNNLTWKNFPAKNVQIKINPDGSIESSGVIIISKAIPFAEGLGYSADQVKQAMEKYRLPKFEVPYYLKGNGNIKNNNVTLSVSSFKIGAIPVPQNITNNAAFEAVSFIENLINRYQDHYSAESLIFDNGKVAFTGQVPEKINVVAD